MAELSAVPVDVRSMLWLSGARATLASLRARGAHALLLHGPAGTGKWELAMSFARDALCEQAAPGAGACGRCASCLLWGAGNHPDLRVVVPDALAERRPGTGAEEEGAGDAAEPAAAGKSKPSREIKIEQVRDLSSLTELSSHRGGARIVVLGPAENLNAPAANALLKGLEEPPPATLFLLVADQIDRCLPTIVSRCALARVAVPPRALALAWLQAQGLTEDAAQRLTEAGGAPLAVVRADNQSLPADTRSVLLALLRRGSALTAAEVAAQVPRTVSIGSSVALFQRWGWDFFAFKLGAGLRYHPGERAVFESLSSAWSLRAAAGWMNSLRSLCSLADYPLNARSAVEAVLLEYITSLDMTRGTP